MGTPVMAAAAPVDEEADAWEADEADWVAVRDETALEADLEAEETTDEADDATEDAAEEPLDTALDAALETVPTRLVVLAEDEAEEEPAKRSVSICVFLRMNITMNTHLCWPSCLQRLRCQIERQWSRMRPQQSKIPGHYS